MYLTKKIFFILIMLVSVQSWALKSAVLVSYSSWREAIKTSSTTSASGSASMAGYSVGYEATVPLKNRKFFFGFGILSAGADARSSDLVTYKTNRQKVSGTYGRLEMALMTQENLNLRVGIDILSKKIEWPKQTGVNASSAAFNFGPHFGFDYAISESVQFQQKLGSYFSGEVFWQLGFARSF